MPKILSPVFSALFLFVLLLNSAEPSEPVRIGLTLGLTGKYSEMSGMQLKGFRLWEKNVNRSGGILGREVRLVLYDDKSDPGTAKALYERLITKDKVDLVFGPYSSEITEAVLPVTEKYGYPLLASGATADRLWQKGYKYLFGLFLPASKFAVGFLELLVENNLDRIAILHADDPFSRDIGAGSKKWAERFGLRVVMFEEFRKGTKNLDDVVRKARDSGAQALLVGGYLDESIDVRAALKRAGWYPGAYFASVGPVLRAFYDKLGQDAELVFSSSMWEHHGGLNPEGCGDFYGAFINAYGEGPSYQAADSFAAGQILEAAVKRTASFDRDRVRAALSSMEAMSILGRYGVDGAGMQVKHFNMITQWQDGKKKVVWPVELRTARPIFK